jgi:hypothetical protein
LICQLLCQKRLCAHPHHFQDDRSNIREAVADNPGITYQSIREIMNICEGIHADGQYHPGWKRSSQNEIFGNAGDNVKYAKGVMDHLTALGHAVELCYHNQCRSLQMLTSVVINEEQVRRKKINLPALKKQQQLNYARAWRKQNAKWINTVFGLEDGSS